MSSLAIVQARMGSTRLPGKVLMSLGAVSVLELLVQRLRRSRVDGIVIATSDLPLDDPIAEAAFGFAVPCVRGPERDVLARYLCALDAHPATEVVRVTADCPLVDPLIVDAALARHRSTGADYCSNTLIRTFPDGLDVEVVTASVLRDADLEAVDAAEREHVTPFIYRRPRRFRIVQITSHDPRLGRERWTLDTEDDLERLREICGRVRDPVHAPLSEILEAAGQVAEFDAIDVLPELDQADAATRRRWTIVEGSSVVGVAVVDVVDVGIGSLDLQCDQELRAGATRAVRRALRADLQITELDEVPHDAT
jgi:spore coat polysaccharide biosynthesis protein SpsF (cytidylyltransferase family)